MKNIRRVVSILLFFSFVIFTCYADITNAEIDSSDDVGSYSSITVDGQGHLAISFYDATNGSLKLWKDLDGSETADVGEINVIDNSTLDIGKHTDITTDKDGHLAVVYYDAINTNLKLWLDLDDSGTSSVAEITIIDSSGSTGLTSSITKDSDGKLVVAYYVSDLRDLRLWVDDDYSGTSNVGEIRVIDSTGATGSYPSAVLDSSGVLAVAFRNSTTKDLMLWRDSVVKNGAFDSGEIITIDDSTVSTGINPDIMIDGNGHLAVSYRDSSNGDLKLWVDDDGSDTSSPMEIRTIDADGSKGSYSEISLDGEGHIAISYYDGTNSNRMIWIDKNGDYLSDVDEIFTLNSSGNAGFLPSGMVLYQDRLALSYSDDTNNSLVLAIQDVQGASFTFSNQIIYSDASRGAYLKRDKCLISGANSNATMFFVCILIMFLVLQLGVKMSHIHIDIFEK